MTSRVTLRGRPRDTALPTARPVRRFLPRVAAVVGAGLLAVVTLAGVVALVGVMGGGSPFGAVLTTADAGRPAPATPTVEVPPAVDAPPPPPGTTPTRVAIPSLGVSSTLLALGLTPGGEVAVPPLSNPMQASWFDQGPVPSAPGAAVVLGHVNGDGKPGVFNHLRLLRAGAQVLVDRSDHQTAVFTVSRIELLPKGAFPAERVYGTDGSPELRLITCGGTLDTRAHEYASNVVAYASLTAVHPT